MHLSENIEFDFANVNFDLYDHIYINIQRLDVPLSVISYSLLDEDFMFHTVKNACHFDVKIDMLLYSIKGRISHGNMMRKRFN